MANQDVTVRIHGEDNASDKIERVGGVLSRLEGGLGGVMKVMKGVGVAFVGGAAAMTAFAVPAILQLSKVGDAIEKMSTRTGIGAESISALRVAADQAGSSIETIELAIKSMSKGLQDGEKTEFAKTLKGIGLEISNISALSPEQKFAEIGNAIGRMKDPTERMNAALQLFGRAGSDLIPLFKDGSFSMDDWSKKAKALGVSFDDIAADKAAKLNDTIAELKAQMSGLGFVLAQVLLPVFTGLVDKIKPAATALGEFLANNLPAWIEISSQAFGRIIEFIKQMRDWVMSIVEAISGFIGKLQELGVFNAIWEAVRNAMNMVWDVVSKKLWPAIKELFVALEPYKPLLELLAKLFGYALLGALIAVLNVLGLMISVAAELATLFTGVLTAALKVVTAAWEAVGNAVAKVVDWFKQAYEWAQKAASAAAGVVGGGVKKVGGILGFATGGIVPGPIGAPVPAIVHGGETVIPVGGGSSGGGGGGINLYFTSPVFLDEQAADRFTDLVMDRLRLAVKL